MVSSPRSGPSLQRAAVGGSFRVRVEAAGPGGGTGEARGLRASAGGAEIPAATFLGLRRASSGRERSRCGGRIAGAAGWAASGVAGGEGRVGAAAARGPVWGKST